MKFIRTFILLLIFAVFLYLAWLIPNEFTKMAYNAIFDIRDVESIEFIDLEGGTVKEFKSEIIDDYFKDFRLLSTINDFKKLRNPNEYEVVITSKEGNKVNAIILVFQKQSGEVVTMLEIPTKYLFFKKSLYGLLPNEVSELAKSIDSLLPGNN